MLRCDDVTQASPIHTTGTLSLSYSAATVRSEQKRADYLHERPQTSVPESRTWDIRKCCAAFAAYWVTQAWPNGIGRMLLNCVCKILKLYSNTINFSIKPLIIGA